MILLRNLSTLRNYQYFIQTEFNNYESKLCTQSFAQQILTLIKFNQIVRVIHVIGFFIF